MPNTVANTEPEAATPLQVAVGIVKDTQGRVLLALRPPHVHQGGLWEFPGGKIAREETVAQALQRELAEELGIIVHTSTPLISIRHQYPDLSVQLNVCSVDTYAGVPEGREGQTIQWVHPVNLKQLPFPAANIPIIAAASLPEFYAILDSSALPSKPSPSTSYTQQLLDYLQHLLRNNLKLIQIRLKALPEAQVQEFLQSAKAPCRQHGASLLLNSAMSAAWHVEHGIHLTSNDLLRLQQKPDCNGWLAASCHNEQQLQHAAALGVDFAVLAPVLATPTHPQAITLGWPAFTALLQTVNIPIYALGGMRLADTIHARMSGAQGVAGIRLFLD